MSMVNAFAINLVFLLLRIHVFGVCLAHLRISELVLLASIIAYLVLALLPVMLALMICNTIQFQTPVDHQQFKPVPTIKF